ncbi:MAG: GDP-mannose 4,6-dehydratase [Oscillochloridaceae bacterium]|nr:GDP-mannose 4,6-dehydratase [Chloroflexaceae bacterium]MDW8388730.1 GDP-mannose 4,6-dehydratase [Oscillochloridaceae bacterium]
MEAINHPIGPTFLITGGAGFIGSHLADALIGRGYRVLVIDNLSTGSIDNIAHLLNNPLFHFARASITDETVLDRLASQAQVVVHLAAAVGVQLIVDHPVHTIETNIMGTEVVLKAALRYRCRTLIASTSEVYGKGLKIPFSEDDDVLLGPTGRSRWAYAASKMVDEFLALAYQREFGLEVVPFRLFNTVGPRQTGQYGMVVPRFVRQALRGEPITVFGDGTQRRCFCDVRDAVEAIIGLALHPEAPGRLYNIGNPEEVSIRELAERVRRLTGSASPIVSVPYSEAYGPGFEDMQRRVPDTRRVQALLGWRATRSLDEILVSVVEYERSRAWSAADAPRVWAV